MARSNVSKTHSVASSDSKKVSPNEETIASSGENVNNNKHEVQENTLAMTKSASDRAPLQPPPDNSDVGSSVSFNTGVLYDQFDNMDSISQIDNSQQSHTGSGIDLQNVGVEINKRDKKIQELQGDRTKLKNLLKKAKSAIDSINQKYKSSQEAGKQAQEKMENAMAKNRDLLQTLEIVQK